MIEINVTINHCGDCCFVKWDEDMGWASYFYCGCPIETMRDKIINERRKARTLSFPDSDNPGYSAEYHWKKKKPQWCPLNNRKVTITLNKSKS